MSLVLNNLSCKNLCPADLGRLMFNLLSIEHDTKYVPCLGAVLECRRVKLLVPNSVNTVVIQLG